MQSVKQRQVKHGLMHGIDDEQIHNQAPLMARHVVQRAVQ